MEGKMEEDQVQMMVHTRSDMLSCRKESILSILCNGICVSMGKSSVVKLRPCERKEGKKHMSAGE